MNPNVSISKAYEVLTHLAGVVRCEFEQDVIDPFNKAFSVHTSKPGKNGWSRIYFHLNKIEVEDWEGFEVAKGELHFIGAPEESADDVELAYTAHFWANGRAALKAQRAHQENREGDWGEIICFAINFANKEIAKERLRRRKKRPK